MKRVLIALTAILTAHLAVAQTTGYRNSYKHYEGKMGKTDVVMEAYYSNHDVSGILYPKKSSECFHVQGSEENGVLNLFTSDNRKITLTDLKEDYSQCMRFNEVYAELYDSIPFASADEDNPVATNTITYTYLQPAAYKGIETSNDTKALFAKMFNAAPQQSVEGDFFYPEPYPTMKLKNDFQAAKNRFRKFVDSELQEENKISSQELTMQETNYQYVTYNYNGLVCIINNCFSYAGGAHGMYAHIPVIFDLEQNRILKKDDIFKPGTDDAIIKLIIKYFIAHGDADDKPSDESEGIFKEDVFVENNIGIQNGNIIFFYQPYDINSYIAGTYTAVIKISELIPYITDNSPIKRMLK
ncbi:MAG: DUF3298 domain-containing protein [Bacteroidales bacterium]|nr:DUF3298 domain-containing protein [Bacteroidales bacterium]